MTRKCVLCKKSNNKSNKYSFFSAPKDAETRRKWQNVLNNYTITDDTYACSIHFSKNDIITHWISGLPPQEIKIKYKKCRLRPGAVPIRNLHSINDTPTDKNNLNQYKIDVKNFSFRERELNEFFLIPREQKRLSDNEDTENKNINVYYTYSKSCDYNLKENDDSHIQLSKDMDEKVAYISIHDPESNKTKFKFKKLDETFGHDSSSNPNLVEVMTESLSEDEKQDRIFNKLTCPEKCKKTTKCSNEKYDFFEKDKTLMKPSKYSEDSKHPYSKEQSIENNLRILNELYLKNREINLNYDCLDVHGTNLLSEITENKMLFEDFLEVYTDVSIPRGWSCLVTSKGYNTTVVYLYMEITENGLPFVKKQVFVRCDMVLRCAVGNREIDPFTHNLLRKREHNEVRNLLDIEMFIDEFDQRTICKGVHESKEIGIVDITKDAYMDGIRWRNNSCSLIVNNNTSRCTKCTALLCILHKS